RRSWEVQQTPFWMRRSEVAPRVPGTKPTLWFGHHGSIANTVEFLLRHICGSASSESREVWDGGEMSPARGPQAIARIVRVWRTRRSRKEPDHPSWRSHKNAGFPANAVSRTVYSGVNRCLLMMAADRYGFTSRYWATFKQCLHGTVP